MTGHPLASKFKREKEREEELQLVSHRSQPRNFELLPKKKLKKKGRKPPKGGNVYTSNNVQKGEDDYSPKSCKRAASHSSQPSSKSIKRNLSPKSQIQGSRCDSEIKLYVRNIPTFNDNDKQHFISGSLESSRYSQVR
jgi:hypothetical protein